MNFLPEEPTKEKVNKKIAANMVAGGFAMFFAFCCAAKATSWAAVGTDWLPLTLCYLLLSWGCKRNADGWMAYAREQRWFK